MKKYKYKIIKPTKKIKKITMKYFSISILVPVFNEKQTIKECINRILVSDTCGLKEIIISDNNSTDGTKEILKDLNEDSVKCLFKEKLKEKVQI